eukprot:TRINITY_DN1941_c0_g1_i16.p1 TRINITY_DN1941_c0_g1~~TRINITY_DN1941_c0_g1_i16.p1  ORF type:complete len:261 (-),score=35.33 TRINITY_DN1941_c0_g1_i16:270-1052(-)
MVSPGDNFGAAMREDLEPVLYLHTYPKVDTRTSITRRQAPHTSIALLLFDFWPCAPCSILLAYEMVNPGDKFGAVMRDNIRARGCRLPGFDPFPSLGAHVARLNAAGYSSAQALDMLTAYERVLDAAQVARAARIEPLDEVEEWTLIMVSAATWHLTDSYKQLYDEHYYVCVARIEPLDELEEWTLIMVSAATWHLTDSYKQLYDEHYYVCVARIEPLDELEEWTLIMVSVATWHVQQTVPNSYTNGVARVEQTVTEQFR